jgi:hypothetical protein
MQPPCHIPASNATSATCSPDRVPPRRPIRFAAVYDWLLFLHLLAAFMVAATAVVYSAVALGASPGTPTIRVADALWNVGGLGTLILGIWLALYVDGYEIWDGWILGAIAVWLIATGTGERARTELAERTGGFVAVHWVRTLAVLVLLVLMVWKPGA